MTDRCNYCLITDLPKDALSEVEKVLKEINKRFAIKAPSTDITMSLGTDTQMTLDILKQLEKTDKVLKIISQPKGGYIEIKIKKKPFLKLCLEQKIIKTGIKGRNDSVPTIRLDGDRLQWGVESVPMEAGHKRIMEELLRSPGVWRGNKLHQKGEEINRIALERAGNYGSQISFRDALKQIRKKIRY